MSILSTEDCKQSEKNRDVYLSEIPNTAISNITLGANMSQSDIGRICNEISSDSRWSHLTVYKAELSTKEYGLNFKQLLPAALKVQLCSFGVSTPFVKV